MTTTVGLPLEELAKQKRIKQRVRANYLYNRAQEFQYQYETNKQRGKIYFCEKSFLTVACRSFRLMDEFIRPAVAHQRLCRHKIIAATQCAIMHYAPLQFDDKYHFAATHCHGLRWKDEIRRLNATFAHFVTLDMLARWLSHRQKQNVVVFHHDFFDNYAENKIWLENLDFYVGTNVGNENWSQFNFLAVAQLWAMTEKCCLLKSEVIKNRVTVSG
ncbi:hypothetical protein FACS1894139_03170 [Planctomycetales bacterium]|nr:hypothetical protein FACS1894107_08410 [Planctomycetales bacterium]GHT03277.1 hypothetical protein FACS1894139_03170 [Planctomycetales bacterium]